MFAGHDEAHPAPVQQVHSAVALLLEAALATETYSFTSHSADAERLAPPTNDSCGSGTMLVSFTLVDDVCEPTVATAVNR